MATIVLLHPFPVDHRFWDDVTPVLEAAGHEVMAPDLPGFGASPPWPGWTMDEAADRLAPAIPPGAVVAGLSMGGYLAQAIVARHPDRVGRLVLADTRAEGETPGASGFVACSGSVLMIPEPVEVVPISRFPWRSLSRPAPAA